MESTVKATVSEFSKVARYKINIQILIIFLYSSNKQLESEIYTAVSKNVKNG